MNRRLTIVLVLFVIALSTGVGTVWGQSQQEDDRASSRVQRAQARLSAARRNLNAAVGRQQQLMQRMESLRNGIAEGEATLTNNEAQLETTRTQRQEADARVQEAIQTLEQRKAEMETRQAAVRQSLEAALKEHEQTADMQTLIQARAEAQAQLEAATQACMEKLAGTTEYRNALTARDTAEKRLNEIRSTGDTIQIAAASQSALEAKNRVSLMEDKAMAEDAAVTEARAAMKRAEERLAAARSEFERSWITSPAGMQLRQEADAAQKAHQEAARARTQTEEQRKTLDGRLKKMTTELASRQRRLEQARQEAVGMDREAQQLTGLIRELEEDLAAAEAEYRAAVSQARRGSR